MVAKEARKTKWSAGVSLTELMIGVLMSSIMISSSLFLFNRLQRTFSSQKLIADAQTVGSIGFFLIGRDIRRAGSNPAGAFGSDIGTALPFGTATASSIQIYADLNGDSDIDDADEDVTYEYIDDDPDISGSDTIRRSTPGGDVTFISNVYNFSLSYIMSSGLETTTPAPLGDIRLVRAKLTVGTNSRDPVTNAVLTREYENLIALRNFQ